MSDEQPHVTKIKRPPLKTLFNRRAEWDIQISAYGHTRSLKIPRYWADKLKKSPGRFNVLADATFQDAKTLKPIIVGDHLDFWHPYRPPFEENDEHIHVCLPDEQIKTILKNPRFGMWTITRTPDPGEYIIFKMALEHAGIDPNDVRKTFNPPKSMPDDVRVHVHPDIQTAFREIVPAPAREKDIHYGHYIAHTDLDLIRLGDLRREGIEPDPDAGYVIRASKDFLGIRDYTTREWTIDKDGNPYTEYYSFADMVLGAA